MEEFGQPFYNRSPYRSGDKSTLNPSNWVFEGDSVGLGFLQSVSYVKPIPTHEKLFAAVGKSCANATLT